MSELEKNLLELVSKLTSKVVTLKNEIKDIKSSQQSESVYYDKYQKLKSENLKLQEKISALEMKVSIANFELEKRNKTIMQQRGKSLIGMNL